MDPTTATKVTTVAAAAASKTELYDGLYVSGVAMLVVFSVLTFIAIMMTVLSRAVTAVEKPVQTKTPEKAVAKPVSEDELDPATVAAITAAVASMMKGRKFRIASLAGYDVQTARWAMAGRQRMLKKG